MITKLLNLTFLLSFQRSFLASFSVALVIYQIIKLMSTSFLIFFNFFLKSFETLEKSEFLSQEQSHYNT